MGIEQQGQAVSDRITLVGLVFETAAGLRRSLTPGLDFQLGVSGQSFEILLRLSRTPDGRLRMTDLAAQTGLTPSGLTRAIDRLEEVAFVRREVCPSDRRGAFAILTELGELQTARAVERHRADIDRVFEGLLSADEEAKLVELLRRVRDYVHPDAVLNTVCTEVIEEALRR